MKLSPFAIFLLLLIIFIFVILMDKTMKLKDIYGNYIEGFDSFSNTISIDPLVSVPPYSTSKPITLLYDNIYFDETNGNVVKVYGPSLTAPSKTVVIQRGGSLYPVIAAGTSSGINITDTMENEYTSWTYPKSIPSGIEPSGQNIADDPYQIFYIPYGDATVIHIINMASKMNIATFYFSTNSNVRKGFRYATPEQPITINSTIVTDNDANNNSIIYEHFYDKESAGYVFQITKTIFFDPFSGNLGIRNMANTTNPRITSIDIYDRINGNPTPLKSQGNYLNANAKITALDTWRPWLAKDTYGNNMVLYVPFEESTIVVVFGNDPSDSKKNLYKLINVCRFNSNGDLDTGNGTEVTNRTDANMNENVMRRNQSFNQYWHSNAGIGDMGGMDGSDYMLKTQIVPPVCPSCPNCTLNVNGSGTCSSVGKTDAPDNSANANANVNANANYQTSGNLSSANTRINVGSNGEAYASSVERYNTVPQGNPNAIVGGVGNVANNVVSTTGNVLSDVVDAANINQVVSDAIKTTGGVLNTGITTVGGSINNVVDKTTGILTPGNWNTGQNYNQMGGAGAGGFYNGSMQVGNSNTQMGYNTRTPMTQQTGYPNSAINGIVSGKPPSNFIPITADFSSFSK